MDYINITGRICHTEGQSPKRISINGNYVSD